MDGQGQESVVEVMNGRHLLDVAREAAIACEVNLDARALEPPAPMRRAVAYVASERVELLA